MTTQISAEPRGSEASATDSRRNSAPGRARGTSVENDRPYPGTGADGPAQSPMAYRTTLLFAEPAA